MRDSWSPMGATFSGDRTPPSIGKLHRQRAVEAELKDSQKKLPLDVLILETFFSRLRMIPV